MNIIRLFALGFAVAAMTFTADAVIAKRDIRTVAQPDGTIVRVRVVGDEHMHFTTTEDGVLLKETDGGYYNFAYKTADGLLEASDVRYKPDATYPRAVRLKDIDIDGIASKRKSRKLSVPQTGVGLATKTFPRLGSPKVLIILVQYKDVSFTVANPLAYFEDMVNGENFTQYNGTGSVLRYFTDQSNGKFTPQFDIKGPVTLPNNRSYYGANVNDEDKAAEEMVVHAVQALDATVDFSQYDNDGDGLVDNIYVIYAGQGEASYGGANTVWPHSWDIREAGISLKADNVTIGPYGCSNEWESTRPDGIGTFVHEFSHVMGLPDLYHTTSSSAYYTPGEYSVLDYGPYNNDGCTPPNYGAYERNAMGWNDPIVIDDAMNVTLNPIIDGEFGLIATKSNNEFFLFENRQQTGWDKYIPGHGMLIWHIDYKESVFRNNVVNNTKSHQYVDIEEANGNPDGSSFSTMRGWPFPGTSYNTEFTSKTSPALKTWDGTAIDLPVTDIDETDGIITFKVAGGASTLSTPVGSVSTSEISDKDFLARWNAVDGATDYLLTVYAESDGAEAYEETCGFDSSKLPSGWSASSTSSSSFYSTTGNYGAKSPSYKFSTNGQTVTSPELDGAVTAISFWAKGQSSGGSTSLQIEGKVGNSWQTIATFVPESNKVSDARFTDIPSGVSQIRFTFSKSTGNIAIDDIVIACGSADEVLPDYKGVSTDGATSYRVDKLKAGVNKYYFTVQAVSDTEKSKISDPVHVDLSMSGVVDAIGGDADNGRVEYYNLQGLRIDRPIPGSVVIVRRGSDKVEKILMK